MSVLHFVLLILIFVIDVTMYIHLYQSCLSFDIHKTDNVPYNRTSPNPEATPRSEIADGPLDKSADSDLINDDKDNPEDDNDGNDNASAHDSITEHNNVNDSQSDKNSSAEKQPSPNPEDVPKAEDKKDDTLSDNGQDDQV